jgi:uncharacterized protein YaeQ
LIGIAKGGSMAMPSTLFRIQVELSDIDQGIYKSLDLRLAMHPSEAPPYLLTRLLAYAFNEREFLEMVPEGLSDPEAPAVRAVTPGGDILLWIEIGNPSARKLHKAAKAARQVLVYTYKDPEPLLKDIRENKVFHAESIGIFSLDAKFLQALAGKLERKNAWGVMLHDGVLTVSGGDWSETAELRKHTV